MAYAAYETGHKDNEERYVWCTFQVLSSDLSCVHPPSGACFLNYRAAHMRVQAYFTRAPLGVRAQIGGKDNEKNSISGHVAQKNLLLPHLLTYFG